VVNLSFLPGLDYQRIPFPCAYRVEFIPTHISERDQAGGTIERSSVAYEEADNRSIEEFELERDRMLLELLATRSKGEKAAEAGHRQVVARHNFEAQLRPQYRSLVR
jgi:hypothetical protein